MKSNNYCHQLKKFNTVYLLINNPLEMPNTIFQFRYNGYEVMELSKDLRKRNNFFTKIKMYLRQLTLDIQLIPLKSKTHVTFEQV